jgi:hypothetical protein
VEGFWHTNLWNKSNDADGLSGPGAAHLSGDTSHPDRDQIYPSVFLSDGSIFFATNSVRYAMIFVDFRANHVVMN